MLRMKKFSPSGILHNFLFVLAPLFAVSLGNLPANSQEPVFASPEEAADSEDFAIQGEYKGDNRALQVVALGEGEFSIVIFEGGLPGDGWQGVAPRRIDGDADVVSNLIESMDLEKVSRTSPTLGAGPPPKAIHLFDGSPESLEKYWQDGARITDDGLLVQGATTKRTFNDYVLHLEFRTPFQPTATGQGRGNSGLYHQGRYENQILDSFGLEGTKNETGSIYDLTAPDVNACFPPLSWQTYDVVFTAATFDDAGKKLTDAKMTTRLNGVIVQNDVSVARSTRAAPMNEGDSPGPIYLQDHGNPVRFRNIWILPRDAEREARRPIIPGFERFYANTSAAAGSAVSASPSESLNQSAVGGEILLFNLGCVNCHAEQSLAWTPLVGPKLTSIASRVRKDFLVQWIESPHDIKPGTTMPDVLAGLLPEEKKRAATAIASYLATVSDGSAYADRVGDATASQRGETLYHSIGCVACHSPQNGMSAPAATSVPLGDLGAKYTLSSLTQFLTDPHAVRPSGRMPKLAGDAGEARDLATYLLRDAVVVPGAQQFSRVVYRGTWNNLPKFEDETPVGEPTTIAGLSFDGIRPLDNFGAVYEAFLPIQVAATYKFILGSDDGSRLLIDGREVVRVDGTHPYQQATGNLKLDVGVHKLKVEYFELGGEEQLTLEIEGGDFGRADVSSLVTLDPDGNLDQELVESSFVADPSLVDEGRRLFASSGCANCHEMMEAGQTVKSTLQAREFAKIRNPRKRNYLQGCLADSVAAGLPDYQLSPSQQQAIRTALGSMNTVGRGGKLSDQLNIHATMVSANCYACHERDGIGGPENARNTFFKTTTMEMGNEGRIPPTLTGVGDKLNDKFVAKYLEEGANERPYMLTRMPGFGYQSLTSMHESINRLDRQTSAEIPEASETVQRTKADGRTLVGNDGLACVKCHTFGGEGTPGIQAIDMLKMTDRLREDWFHRYLRDPQKYRPGTRMPASFPDGISVLKSIADGNPGYQIDAMWQYLRDGEKAKIPAGLRPGAIELVPTLRPILYRNFLTDLTPRGIAVGYPEGVHLAWDANRMALRKIWQNQFLDASLHWQGRGPGNLGPLGDLVVQVESSAPVAVLETIDADWPEKTDDSAGYRFLGYKLDKEGRPAFRYTIAETTISDSFVPAENTDGHKVLERLITIDESANSMVVRFAAGDIQTESDGWYLINNAYRLRVETQNGQVEPRIVQVDGNDELRASIPAGVNVSVLEIIRW